jgi:large subunit ribosomal protein L4
MKTKVFDIEGKSFKEIELADSVFGIKVSEGAIYHAIRNELANLRQGNACTKTRKEVHGSNQKPWRQKGTGRARAGSNRSPLWKGGGVIFGPKPRITKIKLNQKERKLALQTLLYNKRTNISVIDNLEKVIKIPKTRLFSNICKNCGLSINKKLLIIVSEKTKELKLATQNLKNVELILASNLNTFSLLKAEQILLTPAAISDIKEIYCD